MSCFSPCLIQKRYNEDGSKDFKFLGKASSQDISWSFDKDGHQLSRFKNNYILVPCGNCIGCRLSYSSTWADRLLVEGFDKEAFFVTLTYNDDNEQIFNRFGLSTICNDDIDIFIQDLRNHFRDKKIRYALATEYGDEDLRAHAHLILYGLSFDDLDAKFYKLNNLGEPMYNSSVLSDVWKNKGFVVFEQANYYNMAYTARYILKKQKGIGASEYEAFEITPPSFRMSRRPGIGYDWILENYQELYEKGYINIGRDKKFNGKILPNRYFDKIVKELDSSLYYHNKSQRSLGSFDSFYEKLDNSSMTLDTINEYYEFERQNFLKKNSLNRSNFS